MKLRPNLHAANQAVSKFVHMLDHLVHEQLSSVVVDYLMNSDGDPSVRLGCKTLRLNSRIEQLELAFPVIANGGFAQHSAAFHPIRPIYLGMHLSKNSFNVPPVKRGVYTLQELKLTRHCTGTCHLNALRNILHGVIENLSVLDVA